MHNLIFGSIEEKSSNSWYFVGEKKNGVEGANFCDSYFFVVIDDFWSDVDELIDDLFGGFIDDDFVVEVGKGGDEFLNLLRVHFGYLLVQFNCCFDFGDFCLFPEEVDESVDVLIVVFDDVGVFEKLGFFFGVGVFVLEESGG